MVQKTTILVPADNCGVLTVNTFHLYKGFSRRFSFFSDFIKISVRKTKPENKLTKKTKRKSIIVRTRKVVRICDNSMIRYDYNNTVILKKRLTSEGTEVYGPILRQFKKKKFLSSFSGII